MIEAASEFEIVRWKAPLVLNRMLDNWGGVVTATLTVTVAESSSGFGSGVAALAVAVLAMLPEVFACTINVSCAPAFVASVPIVQVTFDPLRLTEPVVPTAETYIKLSGKSSDTCALVEIEGPQFVTVTV